MMDGINNNNIDTDNNNNNNINNCSLHIVFALMENVRNNFEDFYPTFLLHIFPVFHYPLYRCVLNANKVKTLLYHDAYMRLSKDPP